MSVTNLDFLAGMPAVLGLGGYVTYHLSRLHSQASPILKTIVDIIKQRGASLPELDNRLTAKHVFTLLENNPELRRTLDKKDYALLESVMKRDERSHIFAIIGLVIALLMSFGAYAYIQTLKPKIVSASISSALDNSKANTIDDLIINWTHSGENEPFTLHVFNANVPESKIKKQIMASDHTIRLNASELKFLWPHPTLGQNIPLRVEFSNDNSYKSFGPFDISTSLEIMYFVDGRHLTVASMNGQEPDTIIPHSFQAKCLAWPKKATNGKAEPYSLDLNISNGKADGFFPSNFDPDPSTLKCVYFGSLPAELVRYLNLNVK